MLGRWSAVIPAGVLWTALFYHLVRDFRGPAHSPLSVGADELAQTAGEAPPPSS